MPHDELPATNGAAADATAGAVARFWRSLEEFAGDGLPPTAAAAIDTLGLDRRQFLHLMAASLSLAGAACSRTEQTIVPYVHAPPEQTAGDPLFFATAANLCGESVGLLVRSNYGRPTKIEGNPLHPASLGGTDIYAQASVLDLWDPDRSQLVTHRGLASTWDSLVAALAARASRWSADGGAGLRILSESVVSPTLAERLHAVTHRYPNARWHQYQPVNRDNVYEGSRLAFGDALETVYRFDAARVVVSLGADFLGRPGTRYARDWAGMRTGADGLPAPGRLYAAECTPTLTGAFADHRYGMRFGQIEGYARALADGLGVAVTGAESPVPAAAVAACVADLRAHAGSCIVTAGDEQPPAVHALAHAMNHALGNVGHTLVYTAPVAAQPASQLESLKALVADLAAGKVDTLVVLDGNPAYSAPADLRFGEQLERAGLTVHLGLYDDETAAHCEWHAPRAHFLEHWSDARAYDGSVSIQQPLIAPLYGGKSAQQLLAVLLGEPMAGDYEAVRATWAGAAKGADFETFWQRALYRGVVDGTQSAPQTVALRGEFLHNAPAPAPADEGLEVVFVADPTVWDGRFANNAWLQELPKPLTKLTWDNAALVGPALALKLGLRNEEEVELRLAGGTVLAPVWILPGQPDGTVTVSLGYGRERAGRVGTGAGFDAYRLRSSGALWHGRGLEVRKTGRRRHLSATQHHFTMEGRHPVRAATWESFRRDPAALFADEHEKNPSMYEAVPYTGYAWGMTINLDACTGCSACTVACQAENNIPVVGRDEVRRGREMHWIRVDRYYTGGPEDPRTYFQPVPCMHCERAPCEAVCPVEATVHDAEGLNLQVYNRCVGTRFCSNNCPYKVRRFNFLQYSDEDTESLKGQRNPEVTVRMRGVMEKCTYCVQRITAARIDSEKNHRRLADGDVVTACQAACPTGAIVFGDLNDPQSRVSLAKKSSLRYDLLAQLNTRPRTSYLARLSNPNPDLAGEGAPEEKHA